MHDEVAIHSRYFVAASSIGLALFSLLTFALSSLIGGGAFFEGMGGMLTAYMLAGWLVLSAALAYLLKPSRYLAADGRPSSALQ